MGSFQKRNDANILRMSHDLALKNLSRKWFDTTLPYEYHYHFSWLGLPIIQFPQDIIAMQEIVWQVQPDFIIETGIARGGSLVFYASMLELIGNNGCVIGIDNDIRKHNRSNIEKHPLYKRITMIEGSSVDDVIAQKVAKMVMPGSQILVVLDSNHTHDHVLKELELYSPLVTKGSYIVVFDTVIEDLPQQFNEDRPWGKNNSPKTAVSKFLQSNNQFVIDESVENKLLVTVCPDGFLKRISDAT